MALLIPYRQVCFRIGGHILESIHTCVDEQSPEIPLGIEWLE